jgi:hypothetical protein
MRKVEIRGIRKSGARLFRYSGAKTPSGKLRIEDGKCWQQYLTLNFNRLKRAESPIKTFN